MNIAIVFDRISYGGITRVGIDYIKILKDLGYCVDVFVLNKNIEEIVEEIPKDCVINVVEFPHWICPDYYWRLQNRKTYGKYIVSTVYIFLKIIFIFLKLFKKKRKQYDIAISFSGHINDLTFVSENLIKSKKKIAWVHGGIYSYLLISPGFGYLYNKIGNLVTLSNNNEYESLLYNDLLKINTTKIYNPITVKSRKKDPVKIKDLKKTYGDYILMVGRFTNQKDQKTVIDAVKILKDNYKITKNLLLIGDGENFNDINQYIKKLGMQQNVFCLGNKDDVQNYYSGAKIFIHSSPLEGLPTVILEAMSFGVPVVATDSPPGVREILGNNEYGRICEFKNPENMAEEIYLLLNDQELCQKYIIDGIKRVGDFSYEKVKKEVEKLIFNL